MFFPQQLFSNAYFHWLIELIFILNIIHQFMQSNFTFAVFTLLLVFSAAQNVVLVNSGITTTTVVSPPGKTIAFETFWNGFRPNFLGTGATWVWVNGPGASANGYVATFQALFYSDCPQGPATLKITADNIFNATLNDAPVGQGSNWGQTFSFNVSVRCGINNLTVVATNKDEGSPASLIFSIAQDQRACFIPNCSLNPLAYYNSNTCKCECSTECPCALKLQQWLGYPFCGCKCNKETARSCKPDTHFWSQLECRCVCKKKWCPPKQVQDSNSCGCTCPPQSTCSPGATLNPVTCTCDTPK